MSYYSTSPGTRTTLLYSIELARLLIVRSLLLYAYGISYRNNRSLDDDARHKLCAAGGWMPSTQTAELYAGLTLEATKHWSRLMIRPVTLL